MNDADLIDALGGPSAVAKLLRFGDNGPQRVCNWKKRGIPARVRLDWPHLFPMPAKSVQAQAPARVSLAGLNPSSIEVMP